MDLIRRDQSVNRLRGSTWWIFLVFLALPYLFHAIGADITQMAIAPGDGAIQGVPSKIFTAGLHLWNPYVQTGTYPMQYIGWQALYPPGILAMRVFPPVLGYNILLLAHYTLAGFGMFLFLNKAQLRRIAAFIGGLAFMFCGFLTAHKGHHTMLMSAAYLPLIFYFFESYARSKRVVFLLYCGLTFAMSILADYIAMPMYIGMLLLPYMICTFLLEPGFDRPESEPPSRRTAKLFHRYLLLARASSLVFGVGILLAFVQVIPIVESLDFVTRQKIDYDFFASYSFSPRLLPLLIFPYFYGANAAFLRTLNPYVGPWNLGEMTGYMGILPMLGAALALLLFWKRNWRIVFWATAAVLAFLLVLGNSTPFYRLMFHVPIYNMFRVPARNWLEVNFAVAALVAYFVHFASKEEPGERKKYFRALVGVLLVFSVAIVLILLFGYRLGTSTAVDDFLWQNSRLTTTTITIPLAIFLCSAIFLALLWHFRHAQKFWLFGAALIFLDLFSLGLYVERYYPTLTVLNNQPNPVADYLDSVDPDKEQYRILPFSVYISQPELSLYPLTNVLYGFNATNGYGAIWQQDFTDLTNFVSHGEPSQIPHLLKNSVVLSILSTKYLLTSDANVIALIEQQWLSTVPTTSEPSPVRIPVEKFQPYSAELRNNIFHLQSNTPDEVSLVLVTVPLIPMENYQISFAARLVGEATLHLPLVVDFSAENYDSSNQEVWFYPEDLTTDFQTYHVSLPSGSNPPASAALRFFTFSPDAYEIKDVTITPRPSNTRYWGTADVEDGSPLYVKRFESPAGVVVFENQNFLPRARFVQQVVAVPDTSSAIRILRNDTSFNPAQSALVEGWDGPQRFPMGEVIASDYSHPSRVNLTVRTGETGFLVLADAYYVGWKAYVDGVETPIYKTNATTRGILIDGEGEHEVLFQFLPVSFVVGLSISLLTLLAVLVYVVRHKRDGVTL